MHKFLSIILWALMSSEKYLIKNVMEIIGIQPQNVIGESRFLESEAKSL